jgi:hypothetical protein
VRLRRTPRAERKLAVVLFNFPPNAGNTGSAAYLNVFPSLQRTLARSPSRATRSTCPESVDALRELVCDGNRERFGAPANVHARVPRERARAREPWLAEIERTWGAAPGQAAHRRAVAVRDGRAARQRVRRRAAGVRVGGRPDAAPLRGQLRADARLLRLLPLAARGLRGRRGAALRHARRARVHARQAGRAHGRLLAGAADRRPAQRLPVREQQLERGDAGQAARRGDARVVPDAAGRARGAVPRAAGAQGDARPAGAARPTPSAPRCSPLVQEQGAAVELCDAEPAWAAAEATPRGRARCGRGCSRSSRR